MVFDKSSGVFVNHWKFKFQTHVFARFFNSSPPPSPISKSAERISTFSANFQQFVEIYCFCTAFVYSHITFISIFEQKVGRVRHCAVDDDNRWTQFSPTKFFICRCEERNTTELYIFPIEIYASAFYVQNITASRIRSWVWGNLCCLLKTCLLRNVFECIYQEQQGIKSGGHIETGITKPSVLPLSHSDFLTAKLSPSCMAWLRSYPMPFPPEPFLISPEATAAAAVVKAHLYPVIVQLI